jgi:hypothetical protein
MFGEPGERRGLFGMMRFLDEKMDVVYARDIQSNECEE